MEENMRMLFLKVYLVVCADCSHESTRGRNQLVNNNRRWLRLEIDVKGYEYEDTWLCA